MSDDQLPKKRVSWGENEVIYFKLENTSDTSVNASTDTDASAILSCPDGELSKSLLDENFKEVVEEGGGTDNIMTLFAECNDANKNIRDVEYELEHPTPRKSDNVVKEENRTVVEMSHSDHGTPEESDVADILQYERNKQSRLPNRVTEGDDYHKKENSPFNFSKTIGRGDSLKIIRRSTDNNEIPVCIEDERAGKQEVARVDDTVNTLELQKLFKREESCLREELLKCGISFYQGQNITLDKQRRETTSNLVEETDTNLDTYHMNYTIPRIDFLRSFVNMLEVLIKENQCKTKELEGLINLKVFTINDLGTRMKSLKRVCTTEARINWYNLRTRLELEFNEVVLASKNKLARSLVEIDRESAVNVERIKKLKDELKDKTQRVSSLTEMNRVRREGMPREKLEKSISEKEAVLESLKKDNEAIDRELREKEERKEEAIAKLEKLRAEVANIEESMKFRFASENDLRVSKQRFGDLCSIFDINIIKLRDDAAKIAVGRYILEFGIRTTSGSVTVVSFQYSVTEGALVFLFDFFMKGRMYKGLDFMCAVRDAVRVNARTKALIKELRAAESICDVSKGVIGGNLMVTMKSKNGHVAEVKFLDLENASVTIDGVDYHDITHGGFSVVLAALDRIKA